MEQTPKLVKREMEFSDRKQIILLKSARWKRSSRSSSPACSHVAPYPLNHIAKCQVYSFSEHFPRWWLHHFPGDPVPMFNTVSVKKFFLISSLNLPCCNVRSFPFVLSLVACEKRKSIHGRRLQWKISGLLLSELTLVLGYFQHLRKDQRTSKNKQIIISYGASIRSLFFGLHFSDIILISCIMIGVPGGSIISVHQGCLLY